MHDHLMSYHKFALLSRTKPNALIKEIKINTTRKRQGSQKHAWPVYILSISCVVDGEIVAGRPSTRLQVTRAKLQTNSSAIALPIYMHGESQACMHFYMTLVILSPIIYDVDKLSVQNQRHIQNFRGAIYT